MARAFKEAVGPNKARTKQEQNPKKTWFDFDENWLTGWREGSAYLGARIHGLSSVINIAVNGEDRLSKQGQEVGKTVLPYYTLPPIKTAVPPE